MVEARYCSHMSMQHMLQEVSRVLCLNGGSYIP
jgi:hypothetical protein